VLLDPGIYFGNAGRRHADANEDCPDSRSANPLLSVIRYY
jgi:hypothetical protein